MSSSTISYFDFTFVVKMQIHSIIGKEEKVLQGMIDKLNEIGGCYGMKMNVEKTKVMRISRYPLPVKIMLEQ
jgi:hypothetical protein